MLDRGMLWIGTFSPSSRFALRFIRPDPRGRVTDPVGDVVSFIHNFEEKYGRSHPVFYQGTYSQVGLNIWSVFAQFKKHSFTCSSSGNRIKLLYFPLLLFTVTHAGTE